jgi:hypothetical protein
MIDLQADEKVIIQVRQSRAILIPRALLVLIAAAVAYFVAWGFYAFRDKFLFKTVFDSPGGWLEDRVHQTIVIFGALIFLAVAAFVIIKVLQRKAAAKRVAEGRPPRIRAEKTRKRTDEEMLVRKSRQRMGGYYNVEKYMILAIIVLGTGMLLFGFAEVSPWVYAVFVFLPLAAYSYVRWHMTRYILTTKRLVINAGLISSFFWDLPFDKYDEISGEQNFVERLLKFGDLTVNSVGGSREVILNVPDPQAMRKSFHAVREEYKKHLLETTGPEQAEAPAEIEEESAKPPADTDDDNNEKTGDESGMGPLV